MIAHGIKRIKKLEEGKTSGNWSTWVEITMIRYTDQMYKYYKEKQHL